MDASSSHLVAQLSSSELDRSQVMKVVHIFVAAMTHLSSFPANFPTHRHRSSSEWQVKRSWDLRVTKTTQDETVFGAWAHHSRAQVHHSRAGHFLFPARNVHFARSSSADKHPDLQSLPLWDELHWKHLREPGRWCQQGDWTRGYKHLVFKLTQQGPYVVFIWSF